MTIRLITVDLAENITKQILWTSIVKLLLLREFAARDYKIFDSLK